MSDRKRKLEIGEDDAARGGSLPRVEGGGINPYTGRAYSQKYYDILDKRRGELLKGSEGLLRSGTIRSPDLASSLPALMHLSYPFSFPQCRAPRVAGQG